MKKELLLYTSSGCHLCEQAAGLLVPLLLRYDLSLREVEISESDRLMDRYGMRIPVLGVAGSAVELAWPFDEQAVKRYVKSQLGMRPRRSWWLRRNRLHAKSCGTAMRRIS